MIFDLLILGFCALLLYLVWKLTLQAKPQSCLGAEWDADQLHVNIQAFRLLVDKEEEVYLRGSLSQCHVRRILRRRATIAKQHVKEIERNALMLSKAASIAQSSTDPETARAAKQIVRLILEVRLNVIVAIWCLRLKWLFPDWTPTSIKLPACDRLIDRGAWLLRSSSLVVPKPTGSEE